MLGGSLPPLTIGAIPQEAARGMMWEAHQVELDKDLEERVKLWQQSIQPHLEAQDKQPTFDIQEYGQRIIQTMQSEVGLRKAALDQPHLRGWAVGRGILIQDDLLTNRKRAKSGSVSGTSNLAGQSLDTPPYRCVALDLLIVAQTWKSDQTACMSIANKA